MRAGRQFPAMAVMTAVFVVPKAEHFFVVRVAKPGSTSKILLMLPTSTYMAHNDWRGANYYRTPSRLTFRSAY